LRGARAACCMGACLALGICASAETLDRVVASVDYQAITERDVEIEYRFEQFLAGKQPKGRPDAQARKDTLNRLIEQAILAEEAPNFSLAAVPQKTLATDVSDIQEKFGSPEAYRAALAAVGLSSDQVLERLRLRETILDLIDKRLRPQAWVESSEIEKYYNETFVPNFKRHNPGKPPELADVEKEIREILTQEKINTLLDQWIADLRANHRVEVRSF
jgi:SurA-like N-terminal domain